MQDDFAGRKGTAIVTGGSGGIGAAVCRRLAQAGSAVAFTYRMRRGEAENLLTELSGGPVPVSAHQVGVRDQLPDLAGYPLFVGGPGHQGALAAVPPGSGRRSALPPAR
jgi:NAD(P)-dependent dehydrogenase (short-subunit alcohol dehydrogenase family)